MQCEAVPESTGPHERGLRPRPPPRRVSPPQLHACLSHTDGLPSYRSSLSQTPCIKALGQGVYRRPQPLVQVQPRTILHNGLGTVIWSNAPVQSGLIPRVLWGMQNPRRSDPCPSHCCDAERHRDKHNTSSALQVRYVNHKTTAFFLLSYSMPDSEITTAIIIVISEFPTSFE